MPRRIAVIGAPSGAGACGVGREQTPAAIREEGFSPAWQPLREGLWHQRTAETEAAVIEAFASPEGIEANWTAGARAYLRDQPDAELHLLATGHFALEEELEHIAGLIRAFYAARVHSPALAADQGCADMASVRPAQQD
jgi:hypothetical protein